MTDLELQVRNELLNLLFVTIANRRGSPDTCRRLNTLYYNLKWEQYV